MFAAYALAACTLPLAPRQAQGDTLPQLTSRTSSGGSGYIKHIVLIVQENRSFDDFFATFPGADGATTGKWKNKTIPLREVGLAAPCDFKHSRGNFLKDYDNGKMDDFGSEGTRGNCPPVAGRRPYQYVNPKQIAPYWDIAKQYVLADHLFQTQGSGSFTAHQDLIRGGTTIDEAQTQSIVDFPNGNPWGCDAPPGTTTSLLVQTTKGLAYNRHKGPFPCTSGFPASGGYYETLRDLLDAKSISWKYYVPPLSSEGSGTLWNAFDVIYPVRYGSEWGTNVVMPEKKIFKDIRHGTLSAMTWLIPDLLNSDHPNVKPDTGPSWVASVVNAIGKSKYWRSTAIIVVWDDWGGLYDHEPPPFFDNWGGLGFRVPMLIVSPYARETSSSQPGYISHTQYEFGSILKFAEDTWNLGSLGTTDARATSIVDCFDFTQQPRKFTAIPSDHSRSYFERQRPSYQPVDTE
jgi:phospholipase C